MFAFFLAAALAITSERFPDADSVVVEDVEDIVYRADGTYDNVNTTVTKILTDKGLREEMSARLDYNARYGTATVVRVSATAPDGTVREIDVSGTMKESTDNSGMGANIYDPLDRVIAFTIPGLDVGDTLSVTTRRRTHAARMENAFCDISVLEYDKPILRSTVRITAPKELPLKKIAIRNPLGNIVTNLVVNADGSLVYTWTATNSPQAFPEPDMPPFYTQVENLRVSTVSDWPELSRWYWKLCEPHLAKTNAAMVAKVAEIAKCSNAENGKLLRAIFRFVSQEVRYMGLTMEDKSPGYAPHDVDITFDNRYGVCRDKAALLVAMLRIAGFRAYPVLIHVGAKMDPEVPSPYFNHAIVAVEEKTGENRTYQLMDPTDESARDLMPTYESNKSYLVARPEGEELRLSPTPEAALNLLKVDGRGELNEDGSVLLEHRFSFVGINDTAFRHGLLKRKPEDRRRLFENLIKGRFPGAELLKCEITPADLRDTEQPLAVHTVSRIPEVVIRGESEDDFAVPLMTPGFGGVSWLLEGKTSLETRKYPIDLDFTAAVEENLRVRLGEHLGEAVSLPERREFAGKYAYEREHYLDSSDNSLVVRRHLAVNAVEFSPSEYSALREDITKVEASERERVKFAKNRLANADVLVRWDGSDFAVSAPDSWVGTNTFSLQVLTYEGKKRFAEMKLNYNPAFEDVEIVSGTVSNLDGKVVRLNEKEINEMDAGWVSKAPRYPASKIKVLTFPSVEIGSVITATYVRRVRRSPVDFQLEWYNDTVEPTDRKWVRVNGAGIDIEFPKRVKSEPSQPRGELWRDWHCTPGYGFDRAAAKLRPLGENLELSPRAQDRLELSPRAQGGKPEGLALVKAIRDELSKKVKIAGPSLYEVPLESQLTAPEKVLEEGYASRTDYIRTLTALLRGAGFEADVVFAANDAGESGLWRRKVRADVSEFCYALCRVRVREGGFLWFGGETKTCFLGTDDQYAKIGATPFDGATFFDPVSGEFGTVTVSDESLSDREEREITVTLREDGSADYDYMDSAYGSAASGLCRFYSEVLPEERSRHYQELLGNLAQAASATKELEVEMDDVSITRRYSCFIPDFAVKSGGTMTLQLNQLMHRLFALSSAPRQTPVGIAGRHPECETVTVVFPRGYTEAEHLPEAYEIANPFAPDEKWFELKVLEPTVTEDALKVVIVFRRFAREGRVMSAPSAAQLIEWTRRAESKANRTIAARRSK